MMHAMREFLAFDQPVQVDLPGGVSEDGWQEVTQVRGSFRYLRGSEAVQAARLEGKQPVVATVRAQGAATQITSDFRMRDLNRGTGDAASWSGHAYNVTTVVLSDDRQWLEITAVRGVAV